MKKIAIITITWGNNYGNKLQNYAMQEMYRKMGLEVETIKFMPTIKEKKENFIHKIKIKKILGKIEYYLNKKKIEKNTKERINNFEKFNKKIKFTEEYEENNYITIPQKYDYYSVGSDQVWNAYFPDFSEFYLIRFIKSKNKIAYAPSFGTTSVPEEKTEVFKKALLEFKSLSCREQQGTQIIRKLINKETNTLIDPTMLIDEKEWEKVIKKPSRFEKGKYALCYFLGMNDKSSWKAIKKYAEDHNLEIINLLNSKGFFYSMGPSEFLYLEKNAEIIFTDSFHSSVFAFLFNKPFVVFKRNDKYNNMDSRIETLIKTFKMDGRQFNGREITDYNSKCDYREAYKILKEERKKSEEFLKNALNMNEE